MKDFAAEFYKSTAWKRCRAAYAASAGGLCERCIKRGLVSPGEIVHHKIRLTPENVGKPEISCAFDNLELLCRDCHAAEHATLQRRYRIDETGRVTTSPPSRRKNGGQSTGV